MICGSEHVVTFKSSAWAGAASATARQAKPAAVPNFENARTPLIALLMLGNCWLEGFVLLDAKGFVLTDSDLNDVGFDPLPFETSRAGVFAAGDVRAQSMKRVAAAVGDGSSTIRSVHQRLSPTTP